MTLLTCDTLCAQGADAWRRATARARLWARDDADATATLVGPALAHAVERLSVAALSRALVSDEYATALRLVADRCRAVSVRRRASAERYRDIIHFRHEDGDVLRDEAGRRSASICDALFHRAAAAERVCELIDAVCRDLDHALDCEASLLRIANMRGRPA